LKKETPQDKLKVKVSYHVEQGGMPKEKSTDVPVRFTPSLWQLAIVVLAGGLVGALLKRLLDHEVNKITWKLLGQVVLVAGVAEVIAAVAAQFDSKLIILNFDLDPRQLIPAALLAFTITGGPTVTQWATRIIKSRSPDNGADGQPAGGD
jgi:hypothetical protein